MQKDAGLPLERSEADKCSDEKFNAKVLEESLDYMQRWGYFRRAGDRGRPVGGGEAVVPGCEKPCQPISSAGGALLVLPREREREQGHYITQEDRK